MLKDLLYLNCTNLSELINTFEPVFQNVFNKVSENIIYSKIESISNEKLLDNLAIQFNAKGYNLASNIQEKRTFVKKAILLNKYKGTPYSIKEAIRSLGYYDCEINKNNSPILYNGQYLYDNTFIYSDTTKWALFDVIIDIGENKSLNSNIIDKLIDLINQYKNERSHLNNISFRSTINDIFDDFIDILATIIQLPLEDIVSWGKSYDGSINYDQGRELKYNGELEYNQKYNYFNMLSEGIKYDNTQDLQTFYANISLDDNVKVDNLFNGELNYNNIIDYGNKQNPALDLLNSNIISSNTDNYKFDFDEDINNQLKLLSQDKYLWNDSYDGSINYNQGRELKYNGELEYNQKYNYFNIVSEGIKYDNIQDLQNFYADISLDDTVNITPTYDGSFIYNSFNYGDNNLPLIDTKMELNIIKHFNYDGKYNYLGLKESDTELFNGVYQYNGQNLYKESINYIGSIKTMEYL